MTLTWPVINRGREVAFLIEGAAKAQVLRGCCRGRTIRRQKPSQLIRPESGRLTCCWMRPRRRSCRTDGHGN